MNIKENEYIDKYTKYFKAIFFITFVINIFLYASKKETILQRADYKILVQESEGSSNYVEYNGSTFPKNGYVLSSYECENGGVITQNEAKSITFTGNVDTCTLKFDLSESASTATTLQLLQTLNPSIQVNSGTPDFSQVATTDEGLYSTQDDYGTSYYWRGAATTNYIQFGKNSSNQDLYWRIVRINGDESLRLLYAGTSATAIETLGEIPVNQNDDDNAYVGYMYGSPNSSTYEATHANSNSSGIKTFLENWYTNNLSGTTVEKYISDTEFCYDRSIQEGDGSGIKKETTYYSAYKRNYINKSPEVTCVQKNDRFTLNDSNVGNSSLSKRIGLITLDEVVMGGLNYNNNNNKSYLYKNTYYWTGTPFKYDKNDIDATLGVVNYTGKLGYEDVTDDEGIEVVPVINISQEAAINLTGTGTSSDPFVVH